MRTRRFLVVGRLACVAAMMAATLFVLTATGCQLPGSNHGGSDGHYGHNH